MNAQPNNKTYHFILLTSIDTRVHSYYLTIKPYRGFYSTFFTNQQNGFREPCGKSIEVLQQYNGILVALKAGNSKQWLTTVASVIQIYLYEY